MRGPVSKHLGDIGREAMVLPGSARGSRVGGAVFGVTGIAATLAGSATSPPDQSPWLLCVIFLYWICRLWFMSVVIEEGAIQSLGAKVGCIAQAGWGW